MAVSGIHGNGKLLEVTVSGCYRLKDTEWICRQDPYVCLEYANTKLRTRTCSDGGKNPTFQERFVFTAIDGIREISVSVFNENTITYDDFIGSGKIQLDKVLSTGYDDSSWPITSKTGRHAGEVRVIMHYSNANRPMTSHGPSAPTYGAVSVSHSPNHPYTPASQSVYAPPLPQAYPSPSPYHPQPPPAYPTPPSPYQGVYPPPPSPYPPPPY